MHVSHTPQLLVFNFIAKLVDRWRSSAPLGPAPDRNDPDLGVGPQRTNDLTYGPTALFGRAVPEGALR
jgi:hypothetical protein